MSPAARAASVEASAPVARRTQAQRREATVARLIAAATEALIEVGYARTSVQEIATRAGLTQGALFRHFPSRIELMIRVADDVGERLLDLFRSDFRSLCTHAAAPQSLALALSLLRSNVQSRLHQAWFELLLAARTDPVLHEALMPIWARRDARILELAGALLPEAARALPDFPVVIDTVVTLFHGEAVDRFLRVDPAAEARRMQWLLTQLGRLLAPASASGADGRGS